MNVKVGRAYRVYAKVPGKKNFYAMSGSNLAANLIHADIFEVKDDQQRQKLEGYIASLQRMNPEIRFGIREVKGWMP